MGIGVGFFFKKPLKFKGNVKCLSKLISNFMVRSDLHFHQMFLVSTSACLIPIPYLGSDFGINNRGMCSANTLLSITSAW